MKLSQQDADLYFDLMWALLRFVDRELDLEAGLEDMEDLRDAPVAEKMRVREALFEHSELINAFVEKNPAGLPGEHLELVSKWKHFVVGKFYIERILKKHSIFLSADDDRVFGVLALYDSFDDIFYAHGLPVLVRAVLLPFKGVIIYDGLMQSYSLFFGSGYKASFKETYMAAKQNGRLIVTLDPDAPPKSPSKPPTDWRPELDGLIAQAKKLRGGSGQHPLMTPAFRLIKLSLEFTRAAAEDPDDLDQLWKAHQKLERAARRVAGILHRADM